MRDRVVPALRGGDLIGHPPHTLKPRWWRWLAWISVNPEGRVGVGGVPSPAIIKKRSKRSPFAIPAGAVIMQSVREV